MNYKWVLKKDLPGAKAGTEGVDEQMFYSYPCWRFGEKSYSELLMIDNPDWFERVEDKPKRWYGKCGEEYWFVNSALDIERCNETGNGMDHCKWKIGNYFKTAEEAEALAEKLRETIKKHLEEGK